MYVQWKIFKKKEFLARFIKVIDYPIFPNNSEPQLSLNYILHHGTRKKFCLALEKC